MAGALEFEKGPTINQLRVGGISMGMTFELTDRQVEIAEKWVEDHECPLTRYVKETRRLPALGERVRFIFVPTMLGIIAVIQCPCGAEQLLTTWDDL